MGCVKFSWKYYPPFLRPLLISLILAGRSLYFCLVDSVMFWILLVQLYIMRSFIMLVRKNFTLHCLCTKIICFCGLVLHCWIFVKIICVTNRLTRSIVASVSWLTCLGPSGGPEMAPLPGSHLQERPRCMGPGQVRYLIPWPSYI